jgi:hypothetical protein
MLNIFNFAVQGTAMNRRRLRTEMKAADGIVNAVIAGIEARATGLPIVGFCDILFNINVMARINKY